MLVSCSQQGKNKSLSKKKREKTKVVGKGYYYVFYFIFNGLFIKPNQETISLPSPNGWRKRGNVKKKIKK